MGLFDYVRCRRAGVPDCEYQTKDTPEQFMDMYEIREDGTLWREEYDIEDRSDKSATGWRRAIGCMTRVNKRFVRAADFTGEIKFYGDGGEYSAYFVRGVLKHFEVLEGPNGVETREAVK